MSMNTLCHRKCDINDACDFFAKCRSRVVVKGNAALHNFLEKIKTCSSNDGLQPERFSPIIDAVASGNFTIAVGRQLIVSLVPRTFVPQIAAVKAVSWICTNKPHLSIQCLLLRWILAVYDYFDGHDQLHNLYGVIFLFLDSDVLLPYVSHLLFLLTRKEDVKMFRIRKLLSLITGRVGAKPCLVGLLTIYKLYYPGLGLTLPSTAGRRMFFSAHDYKWKKRIREMVEKVQSEGHVTPCTMSLHSPHPLSPVAGANVRMLDVNQVRLKQRPMRKNRCPVPPAHSDITTVPSLLTPSSSSCRYGIGVARVPFSRVDSFDTLLTNADTVEFPSQIAACLQDPLIRHLVAYAGSDVVNCRLSYWLSHCLNEEFFRPSPASVNDKEQLLTHLVDFLDFFQEGIPVVDNFVVKFLHSWNGRDYTSLIFRLLTRCRMYPVTDLSSLLIEPLRKLFPVSSVYFKVHAIACPKARDVLGSCVDCVATTSNTVHAKCDVRTSCRGQKRYILKPNLECQCLMALTELLHNYVMCERSRLCDVERSGASHGHVDQSTGVPSASHYHYCLFSKCRDSHKVDPDTVIRYLARVVDSMAVLAILLDGDDPLLLHVVVDFIYKLSGVTEHAGTNHIILPSPHLVHLILFSSSPCAISIMASAFCRYRSSYLRLASHRRENVALFNKMVADIYDTLWTGKVFMNPTQGLLSRLSSTVLPTLHRLVIYNPSCRFTIFQGLAFLAQVWVFFVKTQPEGKVVHTNQLKTVRDAYLEFLWQQHFTGLVQFIRNFTIRKS